MASNLNYRSNNKKVGSFPDEQNDHFPKISEKSKKGPFSPEFNLQNGRGIRNCSRVLILTFESSLAKP